MFTVNLRTEVVIRILLIAVIFSNALASSTVDAQAKRETTTTTNLTTESTAQENRSIPIFERPKLRTGDGTEADNQETVSKSLSKQAAATAALADDRVRDAPLMFTGNGDQFDAQAYFWALYLEAATGSPDGELWFKSDEVWFKAFKPAPNPVRRVSPATVPATNLFQFHITGILPIRMTGRHSPEAQGASYIFTVTTLADTDDGTCDSDCSLREAIYAANDSAGADTITFSVSGTILVGAALPYMLDTAGLTIDGTGQTVTVSGSACDVYSEGPLTITNDTFSGCPVYSVNTLTILNSAFTDSPQVSDNTLTITDSSFPRACYALYKT